jgi:hypothetical protein
MNEEMFGIKTIPVMVTKRKLKAKWTFQSASDLTADFGYYERFIRSIECEEVLAFLDRHGMVALCQAYDFDYLDELGVIFPSLAKRLAKAS